MAEIIIYTTNVCPYCIQAKNLLKQKGIENYTEIDVSRDIAKREEMMEKSNGRRSVPQIFINDIHIGGFDDLAKKNQEGELDKLLK